MRAARAAECEPRAAGEENYSAPPSVYTASTVLRQGDVDHGGNTFSCGSTNSCRDRQNRRDTRCYNCGRRGHIAWFCWGHRRGSQVQVERSRGVQTEPTNLSTSKATGEQGILAESNNEHELLVLHGMVNGVQVSCLVDSGATHNFCSSDLIAKAGCTTSCESDGLCINLADKRKTMSFRERYDLSLFSSLSGKCGRNGSTDQHVRCDSRKALALQTQPPNRFSE